MKISSLTDIKSIDAYLRRIGGEARSMKTAVVKESHGKYWKDVAIIRFGRDGSIDCASAEHGPTEVEEAQIKAEIAGVEWPEIQPLASITKPPKMIANAEERDIFEFRNEEGQIIMVQVRIEAEGEKSYVPWTFWDDNKWRCAEPDGPLPIYNAHRLEEATTVFIHEGAKAARAMQEMVDGKTTAAKELRGSHPWGRELGGAVHIGWVGGALSPYRTDWAPLKKAGVKRAYIVADNDEPGRAAVPSISQHLRIPTFCVQFTDEFPVSFDLADPFPKSLFGSMGTETFYIGPSFRDCLHPATWATDLFLPEGGKGRPTAVLRDSFKGMWAYIEEADLFVCTEMPEVLRSESILNKMLAPFSHSNDTARLITKAYQGRTTGICYRPDQKGLLVTFRGSSAINLHVAPMIHSSAGDVAPFLEFMDYMFPNPKECHQAKRWVATLIARPDVRMTFGMLLISERQGVGKTTLGSAILGPLVGPQNVAHPSENDVLSPFNEWIANKRLAIVSEIYSGSSWKAYNTLKAVITDRDVTVNQKYMRPYTIENWVHIFASSNSMRALKMENDDRRWFYPEVTEAPWPKQKFDDLRHWIDNGGLQIILHWAKTWGDYVSASERAPMTDRKKEMIEGSRSEAQAEAVAIAEAAQETGKPTALLMKDIVNWCRIQSQGKVYDSDYELRRSMTDAGMIAWKQRIKVAGRLQYVIISPDLSTKIAGLGDDPKAAAAMIREAVVKCADIMEGEM